MVGVNQSLPRLGLGMAALGRPGYINLNRSAVFDTKVANDNDEKEQSQKVHRSVELMQNQANIVMSTLMKETKSLSSGGETVTPWFDCARSYGLSEKFVGEFLRENNVKPEDCYVSSKWGYTYVADWNVELDEGEPHEVKDHSVENFLKQIKETVDCIGDYVNLYQVHSATFESGILTDDRIHEALYECKQSKGWSIGLSVSGPVQDEILREAMKIKTSDGSKLFDSVQCTYNILEQKPGDALLEAHNSGMDVIIKEGMANGRVFVNEKVKEVSKSSGYSIDELALAFILSQPFQGRVLSGAVTSEQLVSNMKALELSKKLLTDEKELLDVMKGCCMESETYWKDRSALAWN